MVKANLKETIEKIRSGELQPREYPEEKPSKKSTKKGKNKKNVHVKENVATPILPTTHYYIKSWVIIPSGPLVYVG